MTKTIENPITRFNIFTRAADEAEGLDEREVVRLFSKRKLIVSIDLEDVTRYGEDDFDAADLEAFIAAKPRSDTEVMDYLGQEPGDEDEDDGDEEPTGSIVPEKYRVLYGAAQNCGDEIAIALTDYVTTPRATKKDDDGGLDRSKLRGVAEVNGIGDRLAVWEERGLNGGLLRMNTSNILRGMNRRGEEVTIGQRVWPAREVEKKARAKTASPKKGGARKPK